MPAIYYCSEAGALRQGELITGLAQVRLGLATIGSDQLKGEREIHPYAIVLSQDCDLDQDWKVRQSGESREAQLLPSVLFAQVHEASLLRGRVGASDIWKRVRQNKDERYHFLQAIPSQEDAEGRGLSELGIDFKRYFTLSTDEVYKQVEDEAHRRCRLVSPYLEHLSTRFCYYQFRVALPLDHQST